jgi:hypothetical protein
MSMKAFIVVLALTLVGLASDPIAAQELASTPISATAPLANPAAIPPAIESPDSGEAIIGAHLWLGMQTGVSAEAALLRGKDRSFVAEAFYGFILTRSMGASEGAGLGGRAYFRKCSRDGSNSLLLGPGLDVFEQFQNHNLVLVAPSMQLSWLHGFESGAGWESGLSIGIGYSISGGGNDDTNVGKVTPLISFFSGLRF